MYLATPLYMRPLRPLCSLLLLMLLASGNTAAQSGTPSSPELFAPESLSTGNVFRGTFTPDGDTFYFFKNVTEGQEDYRIFRSKRVDGRWTTPAQLDLGGDYSDLYPAVSPDGQRLVFSSYRPAPGDTSSHPSASLWYAEREGEGWAPPTFIPSATSFGHYHSQVLFDGEGTLSFLRHTWDYREDGQFVTEWTGTGFASPDTLEGWRYWRDHLPANLYLYETAPGYDGNYILLIVGERDPDTGRPGPADLWMAHRTDEGWCEAFPLTSGVNTEGTENFPFFSPDGRMLYFIRDFDAFYRIPLDDVHPAHFE